MAKKKKKPATAPALTTEPILAAPTFGHEIYCSKCTGMVNHNGCADADCPVKAKQ